MRATTSPHDFRAVSGPRTSQPKSGGRTVTRSLEKLLTTHDLAELLQLHVKTVERMARSGRLPSLRVCGRVRFKPSDIASWLAAREDRTCHGS